MRQRERRTKFNEKYLSQEEEKENLRVSINYLTLAVDLHNDRQTALEVENLAVCPACPLQTAWLCTPAKEGRALTRVAQHAEGIPPSGGFAPALPGTVWE